MPNSIKCQRCLRTFVNYVSGLYTTKGGLKNSFCRPGCVPALLRVQPGKRWHNENSVLFVRLGFSPAGELADANVGGGSEPPPYDWGSITP